MGIQKGIKNDDPARLNSYLAEYSLYYESKIFYPAGILILLHDRICPGTKIHF